MMEHERWAPAPGFEDLYQISDHGRIRRSSDGRGARAGHILKIQTKSSGHHDVVLRRGGKHVHARIPRLVCMAFVGPPPFDGAEVRHDDGNPANDLWTNLLWGTSSDNKADMLRHGTRLQGDIHGMAKLTSAQIDAIRLRYESGWLQREIALEFSISQAQISRIIRRKRWMCLPAEMRPGEE